MSVSLVLVWLCVALGLGFIAERLAPRLRLPAPALLVVMSFVTVELVVAAGLDTGLRWEVFHDLVMLVLLPALVFEASLGFEPRRLLRLLPAVLLLAVPAMALTALGIAFLLFVGIDHPGFPWPAALLTGTLLAATDPAAVLSLFQRLGLTGRLPELLDAESLLNDATAIVLFTAVLGVAGAGGGGWSAGALVGDFLLAFFGGVAVGAAAALLARLLIPPEPVLRSVLSLILVYACFLLAESLHWSGVVAVLALGLGWPGGDRGGSPTRSLWQALGGGAGMLVFALAGATIQLEMLRSHWLAILIGIAAALLARAVAVFGGLGAAALLRLGPRLGWREQAVVVWGGVRGVVALALALSLPLELPWWYTVQSIAYGVVCFSLLVQAPLMPWLLRRLRLLP